MTARLGAALLATMLLLNACGGDPSPAPTAAPTAPPATTSPTPQPAVTTSPTPPPFAATEVNDFGKLCGKADHRAEPSSIYTGPGPHAIVEFGRDADQKGYSRDYLVVRSGAAWDPQKPEDVELLACITGTKSGKRVGTCRYQTDSDEAGPGRRTAIHHRRLRAQHRRAGGPQNVRRRLLPARPGHPERRRRHPRPDTVHHDSRRPGRGP